MALSRVRHSGRQGAPTPPLSSGRKERLRFLCVTPSIFRVGGKWPTPVWLSVIAMFTVQGIPDAAATPLWRDDPGAVGPGRIMPHVLPMAAFQVSHPVVLVVLMKANDFTLHGVPAKSLSVYQSSRDGRRLVYPESGVRSLFRLDATPCGLQCLYWAVTPPSMGNTPPVTHDDSSEAKYKAK
jgi:hypothetical protein